MEKKSNVLMQKYELGRLLGQGTFSKVYLGKNLKSGQCVAIKVISKEKIMKVGMVNQIKREIAVMKLVCHPNIVQLYEVMASKTKIYFAMEYAKDRKGRLKEDVARKYFQQLISAIDFCHSRGVYHRDLKPENLLLDENGNLKVTDFGLSALKDSCKNDGLLHTTCGTPAYIAPEIISNKGYDGAKADIWSCGVVLFVLMAGYLPFQDKNLMEMYRKISKGNFKCPQWFPLEVRKLISRILDPNLNSRISLAKIMENAWFKKGFKSVENIESPRIAADVAVSPESPDIETAFGPQYSTEQGSPVQDDESNSGSMKPNCMNAFDIISLSQAFNLSNMFETESGQKAAEARFTTTKTPAAIVSKLEEIAEVERFKVVKKDGW
ncbi:hypothetical protein Syun_008888 [Stephania yunnanensis]|uniref:non-specific serine/threonine protein kinase n=1 Tax=Stephania yunnanensis TaxID=152371 RepID=A0AAP0PQ33_9MAGN